MNSLTSTLRQMWVTACSFGRGAVLAALACHATLHAAEPVVQWATASGAPGGDYPSDLALTLDGRLLVVGDFDTSLAADGYQRPKQVLHTFDGSGHLVSSQASRGESLQAVVVNSAGDVFVAGQVWNAKSLGVGQTNDFYLAKYSAAGSLVWERTAGTATYSRLYPFDLGGLGVALDPSGNVCVAGGSTGAAVFGNTAFPARAGGPLICKYTANGVLLWAKRVEGAPDVLGLGGWARGIAVDAQGNIVVTGFLNNGEADFGGLVVTAAGPYSGDFFIAKYNASGDVQWVRVGYGGKGVATDVEGGIYFNGNTAGITDMHCGRLDSAGQVIWERNIPNASGRYATLDGKGEPVFSANLYATMQLDDLLIQYNGIGDGSHFPEVLICKADATGKFQWGIADSGVGGTGGGNLLCDRTGNVYVAGSLFCGVKDGVLVCGTGMLGSFPLAMPYPNGNYLADFFIARVFDADAMVPELVMTRTATALGLSWPVEATNFVIEAASSLPAVSWTKVTNTPTVTTSNRSVQLPLTGNAKFFRLRQP